MFKTYVFSIHFLLPEQPLCCFCLNGQAMHRALGPQSSAAGAGARCKGHTAPRCALVCMATWPCAGSFCLLVHEGEHPPCTCMRSHPALAPSLHLHAPSLHLHAQPPCTCMRSYPWWPCCTDLSPLRRKSTKRPSRRMLGARSGAARCSPAHHLASHGISIGPSALV